MISQRLQTIFFISLGLMYLHGLEEVLTNFQSTDSFMAFGANIFTTTPESFYWFSHLLWWIAVPILFLIFRKKSFIFLLLALFGIMFFTEIHHLVKAILTKAYYPGMITAFFYPIVGVYFYKELVRKWKYET